MKFNRKTSKIIASVVALSTVLCFAATGFAAASYSTVTTYNLADGTVTVTSKVTGMAEGEQVTYLATGADGKIVYVDQDVSEVDGADYVKEFSYTTTAAKIGAGTTKVLFGGDKTAAITPNLATDAIFATKTVSVTKASSTLAVGTTDISNGFIAGIDQVINFTVVADNGFEVLSVSVNGNVQAVAAGSYSIDTGDVANPTIVVATQATDVEPGVTNAAVDTTGLTEAKIEDRMATVLSTIQLSGDDYDTADYGVILLMSKNATPTKEAVIEKGTPFKAYGFGENFEFGVRWLSDNGKTMNDHTVFDADQYFGAVSYLKIGDGEYIYGDLVAFDTKI